MTSENEQPAQSITFPSGMMLGGDMTVSMEGERLTVTFASGKTYLPSPIVVNGEGITFNGGHLSEDMSTKARR